MNRFRLITMLSIVGALLAGAVFAAGPQVNVMPDGVRSATTDKAYAWAGLSLDVWGNVEWGSVAGGTYVWDFGDGTPLVSGAVANARNISAMHTYAVGGTTYYATLTVTDTAGNSDSEVVRIDVLTSPDRSAKVNLAIERGLKWLYLNQSGGGDWPEPGSGGRLASTALSVLAFENWGHVPTNNPNDDIYQQSVKRGMDWLFSQCYYSTTSVQPAGNPDTHGVFPTPAVADGRMVDQPTWGRSNYQHGMIMLAIAASGPYKSGSDPYNATLNPALNLTGNIPGYGPMKYYDILGEMVDYVAWSQCDYYWGRGGWRYSGNEQQADTSVCQWPVIGCEAAEGWGVQTPGFVKSELINYWCKTSGIYRSDGGWDYTPGTGWFNVTHSGVALCMLSWCGYPKTDPWIVKTLQFADANWAGGSDWMLHLGNVYNNNYYAMYAIAKGCRVARDADGNLSEIINIGSRDWYDVYVNHLFALQQPTGYWGPTYAWSVGVNTPFAILVLEPTIASLKPQAVITASPNPTPVDQPVSFNVSGSYHQDPAKWLSTWQIDFDSNGTFDASGAFPVSGAVQYAAGYPDTGADYWVDVLLRVTDNTGDTDEGIVKVKVTTSNVAPIPDPGGPYDGVVGQAITLDGSGSSDPNGDAIVSYEWDINGDGVYGELTGQTVSYTWTQAFVGRVGLKVTDEHGASASSTVGASVVVTDLWPVSYNLVSSRRITRTVWEYTWSFTMENRGSGDATNVTATLDNWPSNVTVVDGAVSFGTVPGGGADVTSSDTFKLRIDRSIPVANSDMTWRVNYTAGTAGVQLVNFPLFP